MPELRQNIANKEWVIIATERARRPEDFIKKIKSRKKLPVYDPACPFCPGNEAKTPPAVFSISQDDSWKIRVTPNKYPALIPRGNAQRHFEGIKRWMDGYGIHEVIIETPCHNLTAATMPGEQVVSIVKTYRERYLSALGARCVELVTIFKNHGPSAGTSLEHPHSQLIATPIVPQYVRNRISEAMGYFDDQGQCPFCRMIQEERKFKKRVICETDLFIAFVLYAAQSPFHTWILPKEHRSSFGAITEREIEDFAKILKAVLSQFYYGLDNPDYNYVIRSLPGPVRDNGYYHWYMSIIPRITETAGFELGSGIFINTALPEKSAAFLRTVAF